MAGFPLLSWSLPLSWLSFPYPLALPYEEMADKGDSTTMKSGYPGIPDKYIRERSGP